VNGPAYLASRDSTFLLGAEGSTYLPDFIGLGDWLILNRFQESGFIADNRQAEDIAPFSKDVFAVTHPSLDRAMIQNYDRVITLMDIDEKPTALLSGEQISGERGEPLGVYEYGVVLNSGSVDFFRADNPIILRAALEWDISDMANVPTQVFVHLVCDGRLIAQADGPPLGRLYPFDLWEADEVWHDYRYFVLNEDNPPECLQVLVGLYDPNNNVRQVGISRDGTESDSVAISLDPR
jgi:hypothetical protein